MSTNFFSYFAGTGVTEDPNNAGNAVSTSPLSFTLLSAASDCDTITQCAWATSQDYSETANSYQSFDIHYVPGTGLWTCTSYFSNNTDVSSFDVVDATVAQV